MRIFVSTCLAACALYGQPGKLQSPSAGYVFDGSSQMLRRIQGIPGAALIGDGVDFGFAIGAATVSPRLDSAIVLSSDGAPHLFKLSTDGAVEISIAGLTAPQRVVFSPSGKAAALFADGSVQVIRGLPDSATLAATVAMHGVLKSRGPAPALSALAISALAISDDGAYLLYAANGRVELTGVAGDSRILLNATPGALVAFAPSSHDVAITHAGTLTIFLDVTGAATRRDVPEISSPSAVAFSADGRSIFVASESNRAVKAIETATGTAAALACDCAPTALVSMGSLFRLNEMSSAPLWLLDASTAPRLVFVPAKSDSQ
jgi:DNA-binding beta-propeller fold protein YncE